MRSALTETGAALFSIRRQLDDLFGVWRDTRLIVLVAQTAAVYAAVLIPFKVGIPLIPGFVELRPANALPIVASLLFGPAAAWGAGLGNLIGDCFGTLGPASAFGVIGNFCYGYVPHLLWGRMGPLSSGQEPEPRSWRQILEFTLVCVAASLACALIIAWGVDLLGLVPFKVLAAAIFFNNVFMSVLLAPALLFFLHPRVKRWGLRYADIVSAGAGHEARGEREETALPRAACPSPLALVSVESVSFTYAGAGRPALSHVSLSLDRGESVVLMGRSGAGKSTLCYALNGLIPHQIAGAWSGRVLVNGQDSRSRPVWQQAGAVGLVFQDFEAQLVSTNIEMELAFPLEQAGQTERPLTRPEMQERIARTLDLIGLAGLEQRNPLSLSGGQRQRLVIGSVLIREPALVAFDEPFTDLDPAGRRALAALLARLKASGTMLLLVEHEPEEAVTADRVCVLNHGKTVWEGRPRDLFACPDRADLAATFGLRPLPLAQCFAGLGLPELPLTVEEAWQLADEHRLTVSPRHGSPCPASAGESPAVIEVEGVSYGYDRGTPVLADAGLTIREGEFVALIGQNGSGKSTLAKLLNGLHLPDRGRVLINGQDTRRLGPGQLAARIGYVFQNPDHQIFAETVELEVSFGVRNLGVPPGECEKRVATALHAVGLDRPDVRRLDPFSLTKGDRQRVAVASVLAARPAILIFDEPTTGLDAEETDRMMRMIERLNRAGHTILIITHALPLVAAYARRCLVLHEGRIVADGPTREVFRRLTDHDGGADDRAAGRGALGLEPPPLTRFAARWGRTFLTVEEVRAALRP